jgi:hypothetical protein
VVGDAARHRVAASEIAPLREAALFAGCSGGPNMTSVPLTGRDPRGSHACPVLRGRNRWRGVLDFVCVTGAEIDKRGGPEHSHKDPVAAVLLQGFGLRRTPWLSTNTSTRCRVEWSLHSLINVNASVRPYSLLSWSRDRILISIRPVTDFEQGPTQKTLASL